jgi:serine/threonine-protein kinase
MSPVNEGDVIAGKYRIDRVLGAGGMGVVVAATHLQLGDRVALKFLLPAGVAHAESLDRFMREARAAARIKSEHVARVFDVGKLDDGAPYYVMELLEGSDLSQALTERGPLPIQEAVDYVLQACEATAHAHALGIIHRDLKPANLFVVRSGGRDTVKVLDFGISKVTNAGGPGSMTSTSAMLGSPLYMSPEQMTSSKDVDPRSDLWSLGVILFELLTGQVPFSGETLPQVVLSVMQQTAPSPSSIRPEIPPELDAVVKKALSKTRDERYADVAHFAVALAPFASAKGAAFIERIAGVLQATTSVSKSEVESASALGASTGNRTGDRTPPTWPVAGAATGNAASAATVNATNADWSQTARESRTHARRARGAWIAVSVAIVAIAGLGGTAAYLKSSAREPTHENKADPATESKPKHAETAAAPATDDDPTTTPTPTTPTTNGKHFAGTEPRATAPSASTAVSTATSTAAPASAMPSIAPPTHPTVTTAPKASGAPTAAATAAPTATPTVAPAASATTSKPATSKPTTPKAGSCDPPYTLDDNGHRVPKPECL